MQVLEVATKNVICAEEDENLAKVLEKMESHRIHQLPVLREGKLVGMIRLQRILQRGFFPVTTKVRSFVESIPTIHPEASVEEAAQMLFRAGVKALPITKNSQVLAIVSETDVIRCVERKKELEAEEICRSVITASENDTVGKVRSLMEQHNISRIPLVDGEGKIVGVVDSLQLIKLAKIPREKPLYALQADKEKISLEDIQAKEFMREACVLEKEQFSLGKAVEKLQKAEEIVITEKGKPVGILTPKDILCKMFQVLDGRIHSSEVVETPWNRFRFSELLENFVARFDKIFRVLSFDVDVDAHEKNGRRRKYSLHSRFRTSKKTFFARAWGWSLMEATHKLLDKLEKLVLKFHDKQLDKLRGKPKAFSRKRSEL